jgi:hypothetical protein
VPPRGAQPSAGLAMVAPAAAHLPENFDNDARAIKDYLFEHAEGVAVGRRKGTGRACGAWRAAASQWRAASRIHTKKGLYGQGSIPRLPATRACLPKRGGFHRMRAMGWLTRWHE